MKGGQGDAFLHVIGSEFQCSFWRKAKVAEVLEWIHLTQKARQLEDVLLLRDISWSSDTTGRANMSSDLKERRGDEQGIFILICNLYTHIYIYVFFDSLRIFVLELSFRMGEFEASCERGRCGSTELWKTPENCYPAIRREKKCEACF